MKISRLNTSFMTNMLKTHTEKGSRMEHIKLLIFATVTFKLI